MCQSYKTRAARKKLMVLNVFTKLNLKKTSILLNLFCSKLVSTHCRAETYGPWGLIVYWNAVFLICKWDLMEPPLDFDLDIAPVRSRNYRPWSHGPTTSSRCVIDSNFLIPSLRRVSSVRISYCGKFCCQLWNGHHLSTCFGQKKFQRLFWQMNTSLILIYKSSFDARRM